MPTILQDKNREFKRRRHSANEKIVLANNGLQHVLSSNISAIGLDEDDLIVRFHNGSLYKYPNKGHLYDKMISSNSKGKFLYRQLRKQNSSYTKIGSLPLKSDIELSDDEIFGKVDENANLERLIGDSDKTINNNLTEGNKSSNSPILKSAIIGLTASLLTDLFFTEK